MSATSSVKNEVRFVFTPICFVGVKIFTTKDKKTVTTEHDRNSMSRGLGKAHIVEWLNLI
jgi:hypothetical protein